jgi:hypothetical protein
MAPTGKIINFLSRSSNNYQQKRQQVLTPETVDIDEIQNNQNVQLTTTQSDNVDKLEARLETLENELNELKDKYNPSSCTSKQFIRTVASIILYTLLSSNF